MQKIWILTALTATVLTAQEMSIEEQLANEQITAPTSLSTSMMPDLSLIADMGYMGDEFTLNYAELTLGASVDNYFDLLGVFHISTEEIEIEEAYATTTDLPYHLRGKIGRFKSDFGYLNKKHAHSYHFAEAPLIYQTFLGEEGLKEEGLQVQYVFPTDFYMMAGVEADTQSSGFISYLKSSFDMGEGGTVLAGVSFAKGDATVEEEFNPFGGDVTLYGADLVYKKYLSTHQYIAWQSEYLYKENDETEQLNTKQAGFYTQVIYQYNKEIETALRYSAITQNDMLTDGILEDATKDNTLSAMVKYNFSEFSHLRLQYNHNNHDNENNDQFIVQMTFIIGAHGAHAF